MVRDFGLRARPQFGQVVRISKAIDRPGLLGLEHRMAKTFQRRAAEIAMLVENEFEIPGQRGFDRGAAEFAVALRGVGIADREERAGHSHRIVHPGALPDAPVVDIATAIARWDRADEIRFRRRKSHGPEVQPCRDLDAGKDVVPLANGRMVDPHAGVIDGRMRDAVRIGLRRPDVIVDGFCERLA